MRVACACWFHELGQLGCVFVCVLRLGFVCLERDIRELKMGNEGSVCGARVQIDETGDGAD